MGTSMGEIDITEMTKAIFPETIVPWTVIHFQSDPHGSEEGRDDRSVLWSVRISRPSIRMVP